MSSLTALDSPDAYTIGWIAALAIERAAAKAMLDEEHAAPKGFVKHQSDKNVYTWGCVGEHNVVIASLAAGVYGTTSAATTAADLLASFPSIRLGLMVGIGGGIARPDDPDRDIRLGDVAVSQPSGTTGGVCQYDLVKARSGDRRELKGVLCPPPEVLLKALALIQSEHRLGDSRVPELMQQMLKRYPKLGKQTKKNPGFIYQGAENDRLFPASSIHVPGQTCESCDANGEIARDLRDTSDPEIHYGIIASGNSLVKDAETRDRILADVGDDCICLEMEAAGLMNRFPCLVIRGICDYADSHKNDRWQEYASATAAAYAKELLVYVPVEEVCETKRALEILKSVEQKIESLNQVASETRQEIGRVQAAHHDERVLRWLSPPDSSTNANHARNLRQEGTGAWLLEHPVFKSWQTGERQHLWLHGLAGSGKTVLSTTILDHLDSKVDYTTISFFFDFNDSLKQTLDGMLRSLAAQLYIAACGDIDFSFGTLNSLSQPSTKALSRAVDKLLAVHERVLIILDALDESTTRPLLLLWIKGLVSSPELGHVQLLCTSRPEAELQQAIPQVIGVDNCMPLEKGGVNRDIHLYVGAELSRRREFQDGRLPRDLFEKIWYEIGEGADGMFRWATCQLDSLAECPSPKAMKQALSSLPRTLTETYERMMYSIPEELRSGGMRLLRFLVHANQPLKLSHAIEILATEMDGPSPGLDKDSRVFGEVEILRHCPRSMVFIQGEDYKKSTTKELHLAHFSVKEYLEARKDFEQPSGSVFLMKMCRTYLESIEKAKPHPDYTLSLYPMVAYASQLWWRHAAAAEADVDMAQHILSFFLRNWLKIVWVQYSGIDKHVPLDSEIDMGGKIYMACTMGLPKVLRLLMAADNKPRIEHKAIINLRIGKHGSALLAAAANGHGKIVEFLLEKGALVNIRGPKIFVVENAAKLSLDKEALQMGAHYYVQANGPYTCALQAASDRGHIDIVRMLLARGADKELRRSCALPAAAAKGHVEIVRLLFDTGDPLGDLGTDFALLAASAEGHIEILKLLLHKATFQYLGPHIEHRWSSPFLCSCAIEVASKNGHMEIIKQLLVTVSNFQPHDTETFAGALHAAASRGHCNIVSMFLRLGAGVDTCDGPRAGSALQIACRESHMETVKLLISHGADVNFREGKYGTALEAGCEGRHRGIITLLLDKGAEVNHQSEDNGSAIQVACKHGDQEIVRLLLDRGADVNLPGGKCGSAIQAACFYGHERVVQLLLEEGAEVNVRGGDFGTALRISIGKGHDGIIKLLLQHKASIGSIGPLR